VWYLISITVWFYILGLDFAKPILAQGIENLQHIGICHRDMSLENLLVHRDGALIIDLGMCLLIPFEEEGPSVPVHTNTASLTASFNNMRVNGTVTMSNDPQQQQLLLQPQKQPLHPQPPPYLVVSGRRRQQRYLIRPQGTCGKWIYMSPEVYQNQHPFDGYAVDMWAAGVILFLMLTGFPPWERACQTDERFHYMTAGYLVQMLTEWEIGLTGDAMDLLQRMLFLDPKDRLSLDQVRAHPWMANGRRAAPLGLSTTG
jgi:serine/threonine protein kinase